LNIDIIPLTFNPDDFKVLAASILLMPVLIRSSIKTTDCSFSKKPSILFSFPCFLAFPLTYIKGSPSSSATSVPCGIPAVATPAIILDPL